eukprot:TRINITY_DN18438_c0_g1_i3.p1 TRINITY_DN18438_c0_g1~~TRINITY_DN18438_c0_g1_i3.p1  ORF type:complete len:251 (-),score=29.39 TRINITY_DN18438_c0_g1_i3:458-1210(-)
MACLWAGSMTPAREGVHISFAFETQSNAVSNYRNFEGRPSSPARLLTSSTHNGRRRKLLFFHVSPEAGGVRSSNSEKTCHSLSEAELVDDAREPASVEQGRDDVSSAAPPSAIPPWWENIRGYAPRLRQKLEDLGPPALLAYGLLNGLVYSALFVAAFLGAERSAGTSLVTDLKAVLKVAVLLWAGNNATRPLRVAGAIALAPSIRAGLTRLEKGLKLRGPSEAFMVAVGAIIAFFLAVLGLLVLSRVGR